METVSIPKLEPRSEISKKTIPKSLRIAIYHIFANSGKGVWLVGGTALSGFYAEHRRSDDIDLFAKDPETHKITVLAVKSLTAIGAAISNENQTPLYYRADLKLKDHSFTADVVLDENIHKTGNAILTSDKIYVADIETLLSMKLACLVSRCSEKDMFDIGWFFKNVKKFSVEEILALGKKVDAGMSVESLLISLKGTLLRKEALNFLLPPSKISVDSAFREITRLQKNLIKELLNYEKTLPASSDAKLISKAVREVKRINRH